MPSHDRGMDEGWISPGTALEVWASEGHLELPYHVGGRRRGTVDEGGNDITIKWVDAGWYDGERRTIRLNIHGSGKFVRGYVFGSMWFDGLRSDEINVEQNANVDRSHLRKMVEQIKDDYQPDFSHVASGPAYF